MVDPSPGQVRVWMGSRVYIVVRPVVSNSDLESNEWWEIFFPCLQSVIMRIWQTSWIKRDPLVFSEPWEEREKRYLRRSEE